jgi:hypothetical protein
MLYIIQCYICICKSYKFAYIHQAPGGGDGGSEVGAHGGGEAGEQGPAGGGGAQARQGDLLAHYIILYYKLSHHVLYNILCCILNRQKSTSCIILYIYIYFTSRHAIADSRGVSEEDNTPPASSARPGRKMVYTTIYYVP